jgi:hypothetical protein
MEKDESISVISVTSCVLSVVSTLLFDNELYLIKEIKSIKKACYQAITTKIKKLS